MAHRDDRDSGLQLDSLKSCPPEWKPSIAKYPPRRHFQPIGLWWRLLEFCIGPAVAGRLRGAAFQFALSLSARYLDIAFGTAGICCVTTGDELLSQPSHDALSGCVTPATPSSSGCVIPAASSGGSVLIRALQFEYGMEDQDWALVSLDALFQHARGSGSLSEKFKDDLLMQFGDLSRFGDITRLMSRLARTEQGQASSAMPAMSGQFWQDSDWHQDDWYDDWSWHETGTWHSSWDDDWWSSPDDWAAEAVEGSGSSSWQEASQQQQSQLHVPVAQLPAVPEAGAGKGRYSGDGCALCGSKFHDAADCPIHRAQQARGHGDGPPGFTPLTLDGHGGGKSGGKGKGKGEGQASQGLPQRGQRPCKGCAIPEHGRGISSRDFQCFASASSPAPSIAHFDLSPSQLGPTSSGNFASSSASCSRMPVPSLDSTPRASPTLEDSCDAFHCVPVVSTGSRSSSRIAGTSGGVPATSPSSEEPFHCHVCGYFSMWT